MYGYVEYNNITPEQLLQKVSQEQIFEFILEKPFSYNDRYTSPLREDNSPKCRFVEREDGTILFVDFGDTKTHRTCFSMVMDYHKLTLDGAVQLLTKHFLLPIDSKDYLPTFKRKEYVVGTNDSKSTIITFDKDILTRPDKIFWRQFIIEPEHLEEDLVYSTHKFYIQKENEKKKAIQVYGRCYAIDFIDAVKIYQPYSIKYKWITNCNENHIGNIDNLPPKGKKLVIASSYKDHRVLRNLDLGLNVIWFFNEGSIPDSFILKSLVNRFDTIIVFYDNDLTGRTKSKILVDILNEIRPNCAKTMWLPRQKYEWKDLGEFVHREGRKDLLKTLKELKL